MLRRLIAGTASACIGLMVLTAPAGAATGTQTFRFIFRNDPTTGIPGRVIASGVVNGVGTDLTISSHSNPDGTTTAVDQITLQRGTITIRDTDPADIFHFDPVSCVARIAGSGPYTIIGATGAYAGASGAGTFTATGAVVFNHTPSGCSAQPRSFFAFVTASGPISVP